MPIDPRIAMGFQTPDIAGGIQSGMQFHDQRQKQKSLAELLPQAAHGDQGAIDKLWAVDPNLAMHMDDRQRQHALAGIQDIAAATRWADTPEKWAYVQQHYGQQGVDLTPYRFEDRERGLVALGQIGGYLQKPGSATNLEREYDFLNSKDPKLGDQYLHNKADGSPLVANNGDGTFTIIPRGYAGQGGGAPSGAPQPGQVVDGYRFKGGDPHDQHSWEAVGGPSPGGSATFP